SLQAICVFPLSVSLSGDEEKPKLYDVLEDGVLDPENTVVSIFPSLMHYDGPIEMQGLISTDTSKITRKQSKTGKHGHENQKSTKRSQGFKTEARKVKPAVKSSHSGQTKSTQKDKSSKYFTLVPQLSQK
ncbi:ATP-sulfurylase PUA-like domain-containing protein, partial [Tanacetum coccineum]